MATLAKLTNRILVLPKVVLDYHVFYIWIYLDVKSLEELGIQYRETNYPLNRKAWFNSSQPYDSVARTALDLNNQIFMQVVSESHSTTFSTLSTAGE